MGCDYRPSWCLKIPCNVVRGTRFPPSPTSHSLCSLTNTSSDTIWHQTSVTNKQQRIKGTSVAVLYRISPRESELLEELEWLTSLSLPVVWVLRVLSLCNDVSLVTTQGSTPLTWPKGSSLKRTCHGQTFSENRHKRFCSKKNSCEKRFHEPNVSRKRALTRNFVKNKCLLEKKKEMTKIFCFTILFRTVDGLIRFASISSKEWTIHH